MEIVRKYAVWIGFTVLFAALALFWWLQPERQVRRAQKRLIAALESRDIAAFGSMLANDYRDSWGHNKANVTSQASEVLRQFLFLTIERKETLLEFRGDTWILSEKITIKGTGGPLASYAKDEVNRLAGPFTVSWRNAGGATKWQISEISQPELTVR
jgi:hypothetical protein